MMVKQIQKENVKKDVGFVSKFFWMKKMKIMIMVEIYSPFIDLIKIWHLLFN